MTRIANKRRYRILGTLYLILILLLVFQIQLIISDWLGYSSVKDMLGSVLGIYSALFLGPFLHNSAQHLVENLVVLFIAAGYLEYTSQPTHRVYQIYIITGWFGLFGAIAIGDPAVGASASASGLTACAGVVSYYHLYRAIQASVNKRSDLPGLYLHFIFISYFLVKNINYFITLNTRDGTTVSHAVGAAMGLVFGIYLLYSRRKTEKTL